MFFFIFLHLYGFWQLLEFKTISAYWLVALKAGGGPAVGPGRLLKVRKNAAIREESVGLAEDKVLNSFGPPDVESDESGGQSQSKTPASDLRAAW